jgi:hypothetical protein
VDIHQAFEGSLLNSSSGCEDDTVSVLLRNSCTQPIYKIDRRNVSKRHQSGENTSILRQIYIEIFANDGGMKDIIQQNWS